MAYKLMVWRREMHTSYQDMLTTPANIIYNDLEMMSLENKYKNKPESKK